MGSTPPREPVTPRPAAAVVLLREQEAGGIAVFLVRRHAGSTFMPDVFVFPGGSVKPEDRAAERTPRLCRPAGDGPTALGSGFRVAALRECFEEAGVLLARRDGAPLAVGAADVERFAAYRAALNDGTMTLGDLAAREGLTLATDELLHWSHWITPEALPKRFDTHFFLAIMPPQQEAAHDRLETTAGLWVTPEDALARCEGAELPISDPTRRQLRDLTGLAGAASAWDRFGAVTPRTNRPRLIYRDGVEVILLPDEA